MKHFSCRSPAILAVALLIAAAVADGHAAPQAHAMRITVALFDLGFFACRELSCDAFLVVRSESGNPILPSGHFALVHISTKAADTRLHPTAIEENPLWVIEAVREPTCDRALKDFAPVRVHPVGDEPCFEGPPFSSVGGAAPVRVPDDQVLQCFTMTRLISQ